MLVVTIEYTEENQVKKRRIKFGILCLTEVPPDDSDLLPTMLLPEDFLQNNIT